MNCPICGGAVEVVGPKSYAGLHLQPEVSVFRCAEHGPLMTKRAGIPPLPPRLDWQGGAGAGDPGVRVPREPRPTLLAGAIALPEPGDDDRPGGPHCRPAALRVT